MTKNQPTSRPLYKRILRFLLRLVAVLLIIFVLLVLFIRSPWGQGIVVGQATSYISNKIDTKFDIGKLYITFSGNISLEELYLEDRNQDTLVYSKYLEADVPFRPLLFGDEIRIDLVDWQGLKANVYRKDSLEGFNFQYIIDAFASGDGAEQEEEMSEDTENTTSFSIGKIAFSDFDLAYFDEVTGLDAELILGSFQLESESLDLEQMSFHLSQISLSNTSISYKQFKPTTASEENEETTLPWIRVDQLSIEDVDLTYISTPDDLAANAYLSSFTFSDLDAHLSKQEIALDRLAWSDSRVKLEMETSADDEVQDVEKSSDSSFSWPGWQVSINEIDFQNQKIEVYQDGNRPVKGEFSASALALTDFNLQLEAIDLSKEESLSFNLKDFRFKEESGLDLQEFSMDSRLNSEGIALENFRFKANNSLLYADLDVDYEAIQSLIDTPLNSSLNLKVNQINLNLKDAYLFSPELRENAQLKALAQKNISGNFQVEGNVKALKIPKFKLKWGNQTELSLSGALSHVTDPDRLGFDVKNLKAKTSKTDMLKFVSEEDLGVKMPPALVLKGDFKKKRDDYSTKSQLESQFGNITLDAFYKATSAIDYDLDFKIESLKLGELLQNEELGELNMQLNSKGKGNSLSELTAELSSKIDSVQWNAYTFSGVNINGTLENGKGVVDFDYNDENLQFDFVSNLELDSISPKVDMEFNLEGIRTQTLGLTTKDLRAKVKALLKFEGNIDDFNLNAQLREGLVVYDDRPYYLGDFDFSSHVDSTATSAKVSSQFLNGSFKANSDISHISDALQNHFRNYGKDSIAQRKSDRPVDLDLELKFIDSPILSDVFIDGIEQMDTLIASVHFDEENERLTSKVKLPFLNYQDNEVHGLSLDIESTKAVAEFDFSFDKVLAGPVDIAKTQLQGKFEDDELTLILEAFKDDQDFFSSKILVGFEDDEQYRFRLSPDKLILNGSPWNIPESNEIVYHKDSLKVTDFNLKRESQEIQLTDELDFEQRHVGVVFKNFRLSTITSYFNPDEKLASGRLSGDLVVIEPFVSNGLVSGLTIDDLKVTEILLGNLSLQAKARSSEDYELSLGLKDAGIDLDVNGIYHTNETESDVDFDIDLKKLEMKTIEKFASEVIKDSDGTVKGEFKIDGDLDDLDYNGFVGFNEIQFNLKTLNTLFQLKDEKIDISKNKLSFNDFRVKDSEDNTFTTNGSISIEDIVNPKFDLNFEAKDFQLLNSTIDDNELYFGRLVFDATTKLKGDLDFPKVDLNLKIKEKTNLTYIVPESQASIEERDGVVVFVNKKNPDNILTQQDDEALNAVLTGIDLKSKIKIEEKSKVKVVFNKRTQDNVTIQGGGDLKFDISRTGKMNLVGKYEVSKGSVELNLYNIVKRKFDIASSSSVTWSGDPYDADLDLRAIYNLETSASSLMASQTAGENTMIQNRYKQQLPFMVYLDVGGQLMSPDLSFQLDMPEDRQGAINGSVYGRITQINQQEDQLNKQVFSLLVLNRFYPESGSDGSQGGAATMARNNINQALSDQLNAFSDKLTGNTGISLNFDVNSYTDFQGSAAQDRTEVDVTAQKKLMDDRLVVEAGSQMNVQGDQRPGESQAVVGNVSVEYLLTEDGRWKLRGFRKSEYENVIDGQVFVSGIALIFTREFNKFKVLWDKAYRESLEKKLEPDEEAPEEKKETTTDED